MFNDGKVFYITHIDDYVYTGVNTYICQETVKVDKDDTVNLTAYNEKLEVVEEENDENVDGKITGKEEVRLSSNSIYKINKNVEWQIEIDDAKAIKSIEKNNKEILLKITTDSRFIGKSFIIKALDINSKKLLDKKVVKIKNLL